MHTTELISIGNELLDGSTVNSNVAFISAKLKENGFTVNRQTTIPDDKNIIIETLSESLACACLVIATGGLGPTVDDLTKEAVAELMDSALEFNESLATSLIKRFGEFESLVNQATVPSKALLLPNTSGTAAGMIFLKGSSFLVILPGVPMEMELMMSQQVIPYLKKAFSLANDKVRESLYFFNLFESSVDPILRTLKEKFPLLEVGIYPNHGLLTVKFCGNKDEVQVAKDTLLEKFNANQYTSSDGRLSTAIQEIFIHNNWTLSLAESCTGGAISSRLTKIPGASKYFLGSFIVYSTFFKEKFLNIDPIIIQKNGAVSKECSIALVESVNAKTSSTFSLSVTGIAGPFRETELTPVGMVYIAIKNKNGALYCTSLHAKGDRSIIIEQAVNFCLGELYRFVTNN